MKKVAILSITRGTDQMMQKIMSQKRYEYVPFDSTYCKENKLSIVTRDIFGSVDAVIFLSSLGICVRVIAPWLKSKTQDPAVVCIPNDGSLAISVVGGHLSGANNLAYELADYLGAQPIITTATDIMGIKAPDMLAAEHGFHIESMSDCKKIASLLVDGAKVAILDDAGKISESGYEDYYPEAEYAGVVHITNKTGKVFRDSLMLIRKNIVLGIGCRKNYAPDKMLKQVREKLNEMDIHEKSVARVCSIDLKAKETAIINLSRFFSCPYKIYTADEIVKVEHLFNTSFYVKKAVGVGSVAEPCVHLSGADIIMAKINMYGMTMAIGELRR